MSRYGTLLVGLTGKAGSGKDLTGVYLDEAFSARGIKCSTLAFADPIRAMLAGVGVPQYAMAARDKKEAPLPEFGGKSYREMAQTLGDWGRSLHPDFWVQVMEQRMVHYLGNYNKPRVLIITDVRYTNEATWVTNGRDGIRGAVLRVVRPDVAEVRPHSSEQQTILADHEIANDHDKINLRMRCGRMADQLTHEAELMKP